MTNSQPETYQFQGLFSSYSFFYIYKIRILLAETT